MFAVEDANLLQKTVCIVPIFNEASVLDDVLKELIRVFPHVICVDDGSTDGSAKISAKNGCQTVVHLLNIGQGAALVTGLRVAARNKKFVYAITFDSDGQHSPQDAVNLVRALNQSTVDIVFGSRFMGAPQRSIPINKRLMLRSVVKLRQLRGRTKLTDTHNGLRALRISVFSELDFFNYGMAHASELIEWVLKRKIRYSEAPVDIRYSDYSRQKGQTIWNSVNIIYDLLMK